MKYLYKKGILFTLFIVGFWFNEKLVAQTSSIYNWQLGVGIGYTNYYGDLSNYRINGANELYKIYKFAGYNQYYQHQPSLSILLQKKLTPTLGIMFQANYLQFEMSDRYRKNNGMLDTASYNYSRSLNFRTTMQDFGLAFTFSPNNGRIGSEKAFFYPSFFLGAGVSTFVVKGDLYDANNNPYNYRLPGNINDGTYETNLRDQLNETDNKYKNTVPYVDLGLALNFRLNDLLTIALQSDIKYSASDYLDDVSATYKPTYPTATAAYIAKPGYNPVTLNRGDNNGINDFYINNRIVFSFSLARKHNVPKTFNPPVVYSLYMPYTRQNKLMDSSKKQTAVINDSVMRLYKTDSLNRAIKDSVFLLGLKNNQSSVKHDSVVDKQLQSITTELKSIKGILRDQQILPRLAQLQYQSDSIKALRNRVMIQRPATRESSLQLRVYDLQIDSLRTESEKIRVQQNYSQSSIDSMKMIYYPVYVPAKQPVENANHPVEKAVTATSYDTTMRSNYLKKMDSIQRRLNELEKKSGYNDSTSKVIERRNRQRADDSISYNRHASEIENRIKREEDSLSLLQRQLRSSQDSATHYKSLKERSATSIAPDTIKQKKTFFQRYLGIGNKKKKTPVKTDTIYSADYTNQQQYYETQMNAMNDKISALENNRNNLVNEKVTYDRKNNVRADSLDYVRNLNLVQQRIQRNSDSMALLQRQLKISNDSVAFYNKQMAAASEKAAAEGNEKWYQNMFESERKRQRRLSDENAVRDNTITQQQYYDNDVKNMQQRINDLEARNRDLTNSYQNLDADRNQQKWNTAPVIPLTVVGAGNGYNDGDHGREIADLRAELQNLKNEVNYDSRGNYTLDTTLSRKSYTLDTTLTAINNRKTDSLAAKPVVQDSSQLSLLRDELNRMRGEIDSLKRKPVAVVSPTVIAEKKPAKTEPKFEASSFPIVSVYFNLGSAALTGAQLNKITPFAQAANNNKETSIVLKGFTDPVGNPAKNKIIANKRSEYIKNYLVSRYKITGDRITVEEPAEPDAGSGKKANPLDRRVDLQFQ